MLEEQALRPTTLDTFTGQAHFIPNLRVFIASAKKRGVALDHVLLEGPPGLGKTTLAQIIGNEMGNKTYVAMAPSIKKNSDLINLFGQVHRHEIVFLDEIHRLTHQMAEILYPMMEDFKTVLHYGEGRSARQIVASIEPFTLIGATTRAGALPQPLRDRFGIHLALKLYSPDDLAGVVKHASQQAGIAISDAGSSVIAARARGTPRIALQLLRRINDFAVANGLEMIGEECVNNSLTALGIDEFGLNPSDRQYLSVLGQTFNGGPAGIEAIASAMGDDRDNIEDMIEPYLLREGFVHRTGQGRMLSESMLNRYVPNMRFGAAK